VIEENINSLFTCKKCSYLGTAEGDAGKRMHRWHILCDDCKKEYNYTPQQGTLIGSAIAEAQDQVFLDEILYDNPDEKGINPWTKAEFETCKEMFKEAADLDLRDSAMQFVKWAQLYGLA
jgi:hypothetical protein